MAGPRTVIEAKALLCVLYGGSHFSVTPKTGEKSGPATCLTFRLDSMTALSESNWRTYS